MISLACMQPRDRVEASRMVLLLSGTAAVITILVAVLRPQQAGGMRVALGVVLPVAGLVVLAAYRLTRADGTSQVAWAFFPFATVAVVTALDVATADASTGAQVFLFFPVIYAAFNLPRAGALVSTGASIAADLVVVISLMPTRAAVVDIIYVAAALMTIAGVLIYASERRAALLVLLHQQAAIDPLTGLATRRVLDQAAQSVLQSASKSTGTGLILIDIDRFKSINDHHGHLAGDEVLVGLAVLLTRTLRADSILSRMGGDEIAILMPGCSRDEAFRHANDLCGEVRAHPFVVLEGGLSLTLTVSVGVAHAPTQANSFRTLYAAADAALYQAKRGGRDRVAALPVIANDTTTRPHDVTTPDLPDNHEEATALGA